MITFLRSKKEAILKKTNKLCIDTLIFDYRGIISKASKKTQQRKKKQKLKRRKSGNFGRSFKEKKKNRIGKKGTWLAIKSLLALGHTAAGKEKSVKYMYI